ncbi:MAG TPA: DUF3592 domain-containing protein [Caldimonas sp.]|nr:DUF3592 domain-containing protein [Caldimonas sp.]HEX4233368.1 DUF3592 domain-containing protein [Caldimonas sp.]
MPVSQVVVVHPPGSAGRLRGILLGAVPIVLGLVLAAAGGMAYWERDRAGSWLEVPAQVLSSSLVVTHGSKGGASYFPRVSYAYAISGVRHVGGRVRFGTAAMEQDEAQQLVRAYPEGATLSVFVDPANSENSILDRSNPSGVARWQLGIGVALVLIGAVVATVMRGTRW